MKKTSRIIMVVAMGATAFTSLAGMVRANERDATLRYNIATTEVEGEGEEEATGFSFESTGRYDNGFQYDIRYMNLEVDDEDGTEVDGVEGSAGEFNVRYLFNHVGPQATYLYEDTTGENIFGIGIAAEVEGDRARGYGSLVSDVDDLGDTFRFQVGGEMQASEFASVRLEYQRWNYDHDTDADAIEIVELGGRFGIYDNTYIDATITKPLETGDVDTSIFGVGLGLKF